MNYSTAPASNTSNSVEQMSHLPIDLCHSHVGTSNRCALLLHAVGVVIEVVSITIKLARFAAEIPCILKGHYYINTFEKCTSAPAAPRGAKPWCTSCWQHIHTCFVHTAFDRELVEQYSMRIDMSQAICSRIDATSDPQQLPCFVPAAPGSRLSFTWGTGCQLLVTESWCPSTGAGGDQPFASACEWYVVLFI